MVDDAVLSAGAPKITRIDVPSHQLEVIVELSLVLRQMRNHGHQVLE